MNKKKKRKKEIVSAKVADKSTHSSIAQVQGSNEVTITQTTVIGNSWNDIFSPIFGLFNLLFRTSKAFEDKGNGLIFSNGSRGEYFYIFWLFLFFLLYITFGNLSIKNAATLSLYSFILNVLNLVFWIILWKIVSVILKFDWDKSFLSLYCIFWFYRTVIEAALCIEHLDATLLYGIKGYATMILEHKSIALSNEAMIFSIVLKLFSFWVFIIGIGKYCKVGVFNANRFYWLLVFFFQSTSYLYQGKISGFIFNYLYQNN